MQTRSSNRAASASSNSEYNPNDDHSEDQDAEGESEKPQEEDESDTQPKYRTSRMGRTVREVKYLESSDGDDDFNNEGDDVKPPKRTKASSAPAGGGGSRKRSKNLQDFVSEDEDENDNDEEDYGKRRYALRNRSSGPPQPKASAQSSSKHSNTRRSGRLRRKRGSEEEDYVDDGPSSPVSADASMDDVVPEESDLEVLEAEPEPEPEQNEDGKYDLRRKPRLNYALPTLAPPPPKNPSGRSRGGSKKGNRLNWSASGAELGRWMGMPNDDSDSDHPTRTPRKPFGGLNPYANGAVPAGGMYPADLAAAAGTPSNLGKVGEASLADADPLGVNQNVTFDEVGGLDDHIHALKEMTLLPLLYPEVFQRFNITPPRGVLFHGPPGTGKTLLARALAASSRSGGRQISFFMRKGADALSKWVGEAERQLRLLFEEARNCQPSIIFFDEIDGLAPVRSSKQDQIHASIVSTLLALMDGMDGRGQVIVIGATNRPDAIDPALRRPGRFDREFYFGLPGLDAREKILSIMTKKWENWNVNEEGEKGEKAKEKLRGLAKLTKGYGGADLRALCTEAALNAIQRRYPQVYKSTDRLLLKPETIDVGLRDFMISIKKIVPSSARSSTSAATSLPPQFEPLLSEALEKTKDVIQRVMPIEKKLSALEEAEFEDEGGEDGALDREMLSQAMQTLRVYRPRVIIHGPVGMGQNYIGAAALHHLEGYHIQSLELGTLLGDSTRSIEAAIVQLFVEAKRHQPSVIYIPSLVGWCAAVPETSRTTVRAMLETLLPTDPILLLAVVDGTFSSLPKDVKAWFGPSKDNRVQLVSPTADQRGGFFEPLLKDICRPPNQFADGMKRKKRVLEVLPIAPPLEPRKPTAAELALQQESDQRTLALLKFRLGPILAEMKRKFKRFTKRATEEYNFEPGEDRIGYAFETVATGAGAPIPDGPIDVNGNEQATQAAGNDDPFLARDQAMLQRPILYDMDLERMHSALYKDQYLTPQDFLEDVSKMVHNAEVRSYEDLDRFHKAQAMYTAAQVSILEFDPQFRMECERMAGRERQRRGEAEKAKEKGKEKEKDTQVNGVATRSTRSNPVEDLVMLTDPSKLERLNRKKRKAELSGILNGTNGSSNSSGDDGEQGRETKRSKMLIDDDVEGPDPINFLGTPQRSVRFENPLPSINEQPMDHFGGPGAGQLNPNPSQWGGYQQNPDGHVQQPPLQPHMYGTPQPQYGHPQPAIPQSHPGYPAGRFPMDGVSTPQGRGFEGLLNPMSPTGGSSAYQLPPHSSMPIQPSSFVGEPMNTNHNVGILTHILPPSYQQTSGFAPHDANTGSVYNLPEQGHPYPQDQSRVVGLSSMFNDPGNPFVGQASQPPSQPSQIPSNYFQQEQYPQQEQPRAQLQVPQEGRVSRANSPRLPSALRNSKTPEVEPRSKSAEPPVQGEKGTTPAPEAAEGDSAAMVVEPVAEPPRSPSPPLPDFHVDEGLLDTLRRTLREKTEGLNVEQLEQLRATCLGDVWRYRKEWDRDELVKTLLKVVEEFLEEVNEVEEWEED